MGLCRRWASKRLFTDTAGRPDGGAVYMRSKMGLLSYKGAVASYEYNHYEGDLPIMLGTDRRGEVIMGDLARMGNLLLWGVGVELSDFLEGLLSLGKLRLQTLRNTI